MNAGLLSGVGGFSPSPFAGVGFTSLYESPAQVITDAGVLVLQHKLSKAPLMVWAFLQCLSAEAGYSPGDMICAPLTIQSGSVPKGLSIFIDAVNITVRFSNGGGNSNTFYSIHKSDGTAQILTNAKWQLFVKALG